MTQELSSVYAQASPGDDCSVRNNQHHGDAGDGVESVAGGALERDLAVKDVGDVLGQRPEVDRRRAPGDHRKRGRHRVRQEWDPCKMRRSDAFIFRVICHISAQQCSRGMLNSSSSNSLNSSSLNLLRRVGSVRVGPSCLEAVHLQACLCHAACAECHATLASEWAT